MFMTVSFAHAEKSNFCVLNVERLVSKFSAKTRDSLRWVLVGLDSAALDKHALDDAADFGVDVGEVLAIFFFESFAKSQEVLNGARRNVCEEFEDDLVFGRVGPELH